jgi:hypothetical protein
VKKEELLVNILKEIMNLAEKGVAIDYVVVDQKENGSYMDGEALKTYTVSVFESSSLGEDIDSQCFDDLEKGLLWGIERARDYLESITD